MCQPLLSPPVSLTNPTLHLLFSPLLSSLLPPTLPPSFLLPHPPFLPACSLYPHPRSLSPPSLPPSLPRLSVRNLPTSVDEKQLKSLFLDEAGGRGATIKQVGATKQHIKYFTDECGYTYVSICGHVCLYLCVCVCIFVHMCMCVCQMSVHMHAITGTFMYVYMCTGYKLAHMYCMLDSLHILPVYIRVYPTHSVSGYTYLVLLAL